MSKRFIKDLRENEEKRRQINYANHVKLIADAEYFSFEQLCRELQTLSPLSKPLPQYREGCTTNCLPTYLSQNLLESIHKNTKLKPLQKMDLIAYISCNLEYRIYTDLQIQTDYLKYYENLDCLLNVYAKTVKYHNIGADLEHNIWNLLYNVNNGREILNKLFNFQDNGARILNFIDFWFNRISTPAALVSAHNFVKQYNTTCFSIYSSLVEQLYEQRLFELHLQMYNNGQGKVDPDIKNEFKTKCPLLPCIFKSKMAKLFELSFQKPIKAQKEFAEMKSQLEKEINIKIENCAYAKPEVTFRHKESVGPLRKNYGI